MQNQPIIEIKNLNKTFKTSDGEVNALKDINLTINKGDIYGIIGMSGAGKSTLVRCINYLEMPTSGSVIIDNEEMGSLSSKELRMKRHKIGMIFQHFNLLMQSTVLKNVLFPLEIVSTDKKEAEKRALELLELVSLKDKVNAYPSQLSGGQKQRVAIARALATSPDVLLCDEATSALDPNTTDSILELLKDINERLGITIVIITHEMSVVEKICSHVAVIENSRITETGSVKDIFTHPKSNWAKNIISPHKEEIEIENYENCIRIVFDDSPTKEQILADMILSLNVKVSILYADMKNIKGKAFGQMIVRMSENKEEQERIIRYLKEKGLVVEKAYE